MPLRLHRPVRCLRVALLLLLPALVAGCSIADLVIVPQLNASEKAFNSQPSPDFARDAAPGLIGMLDGFIAGHPDHVVLLTKGAKMNASFAFGFLERGTERDQGMAPLLYWKARGYGLRALKEEGIDLEAALEDEKRLKLEASEKQAAFMDGEGEGPDAAQLAQLNQELKAVEDKLIALYEEEELDLLALDEGPSPEEAALKEQQQEILAKRKALIEASPTWKQLQAEEAAAEHRFQDELDKVDEDLMETLFWTAFAWGSWVGQNRTDIDAVAQLSTVQYMMERVMELDEVDPGILPPQDESHKKIVDHYRSEFAANEHMSPEEREGAIERKAAGYAYLKEAEPHAQVSDYFNGGVHLFFGIRYGEMGESLGGNPPLAEWHFEKVFQLTNNQFLMAHVTYARVFQKSKPQEALEHLKLVLEAPDDIDPDNLLLVRLAKRHAAELMPQVEEELRLSSSN